jgi:ribosomal protein S27E
MLDGVLEMTCRKCGTEIAAKAIICYKCGTATTEPAGGGLQVDPAGVGRNFSSGRGGGTKVPAYVWVIIAGLVVAVAIWWFQYR